MDQSFAVGRARNDPKGTVKDLAKRLGDEIRGKSALPSMTFPKTRPKTPKNANMV
jgi:hypothetical protein